MQNRVLPTGEIVAEGWRGTLMGNRGILHDESRRLGEARWRHASWIACRLSFKARHRQIMAPRRYTELFFPDDASALAAGHRPCFECRRAQAVAFRAAWTYAFGHYDRITRLDRDLHVSRILPRSRAQRRHRVDCNTLPDHVFILHQNRPARIDGDVVQPFVDGRYRAAERRPVGSVTVLTPAPIVTILANGYAPEPQHRT